MKHQPIESLHSKPLECIWERALRRRGATSLWEIAPTLPSSSIQKSPHWKSFHSRLNKYVCSPDWIHWAAVCETVCIFKCAECGQMTSGSVMQWSNHCWEYECVSDPGHQKLHWSGCKSFEVTEDQEGIHSVVWCLDIGWGLITLDQVTQVRVADDPRPKTSYDTMMMCTSHTVMVGFLGCAKPLESTIVLGSGRKSKTRPVNNMTWRWLKRKLI